MKDLTVFNYQELTFDIQAIAKDAALDIRSRERSIWENAIAIGEKLIEIKSALPHGSFMPWVAHEFGWGQVTANKYMQVAKELSNSSQGVNLNGLGMKTLQAIASATAKLDDDEKPKLLESIAVANEQKIEVDGRSLTEKEVRQLIKDADILQQQNLKIESEKATAIANLEQRINATQHNLEKIKAEDKERFDAVLEDRLGTEVAAMSKEFDQELNRLNAEKVNLERQLAELQINPTPEMKAAIATVEQAKRLAERDLEILEKKQAELQKQIDASAEIANQVDKANRAVGKFHQAIAGIYANHGDVFGLADLSPVAKSQLIEAQTIINHLAVSVDLLLGDRPQKVVQINKKTIEIEAV